MTDPFQLNNAIRTLLSGLRFSNYQQKWAKGSPAVQALSILSEHVGEGPVIAGELMDPKVTTNYLRPTAVASAHRISEPRSPELALARNIVNQIGDLLSERVPSDEWVKARQETNDELDLWVSNLIADRLQVAREASRAEGYAAGSRSMKAAARQLLEDAGQPELVSTLDGFSEKEQAQ